MNRLVFGKHWRLEAEPHIILRAKRIFAKSHKATMGYVELSDSAENARDLEWFVARYPIEVEEPERLRARADAHREEEALVDRLLRQRGAVRPFELALPPREYQRVAAELCLGTGGLLLADDVGTGKTVSAICSFTEPSTLPALVVTLTHLPRQWEREVNRFCPSLRTHILRKGKPYDLTRLERSKKVVTPLPDVLITSYSKLAGWAETLSGVVRSVVFDECQELRTGPGTAKYEGAKHIAGKCVLRWGCSATPIYNFGGEFWNVMDMIRPGVLGERHEFDREWCKHGDKAIDDPRSFGAYARRAGFMLRRTRADVGRELPPLQSVVHHIEADLDQLEAVAADCSELAKIILTSDKQKRGEKFFASEDFSNTLRQATGIAKAPYVAEFVRLLAESEKIVLYGWHRSVYDIWLKLLRDLNPRLYTGSESVPQKQAAFEAFCGGDCRILIVSLRSGAGLDGLQHHCRTVVFGELDWSPGVHVQNVGRVFRDGQPDSVVAYYLLADDGADPIMADVLGLKRAQADGIIDPRGAATRPLGVDPDHVLKLAQDYLRRRGLSLPPPPPEASGSEVDPQPVPGPSPATGLLEPASEGA